MIKAFILFALSVALVIGGTLMLMNPIPKPTQTIEQVQPKPKPAVKHVRKAKKPVHKVQPKCQFEFCFPWETR